MPEMNPKLSDEQMKELEEEALRNATVGTPVSYTHLTLPTTPYV